MRVNLKKSESLSADLRIGGLGDVWMRLVGFYAMAALHTDVIFRLTVPRSIESIAFHVFGDRLNISVEANPEAIVYSVRGVRELLPQALGRCRFAAPYGRAVIKTWNRWTLRDRLNSFLYTVADWSGLVYSPPWDSLSAYQGYSETILFPLLRNVSYFDFHTQAILDRDSITQRVKAFACKSACKVSSQVAGAVLVFPTGTGRQFIPLEWAQTHLPNALFALHDKDAELKKWQASGLHIVIYSKPGDIAAMGAKAAVTITTDSFPSHILQYSGGRIIILITGTERPRVVSPGFPGHVVDAVAPCHPCPHLERRGFPRCKAGLKVCRNWDSLEYTGKILELTGCKVHAGSK